MDLKGFIADQMGFFSPGDIPNLLFSILLAAILTFGLSHIQRGWRSTARSAALLAAILALAVGLVKGSLPLAVAMLAVLMLVRMQVPSERNGGILHVLAVVIGAGCGAGASVIVLIASPVLALLLWWSREKVD